jgi:hypothetical protein
MGNPKQHSLLNIIMYNWHNGYYKKLLSLTSVSSRYAVSMRPLRALLKTLKKASLASLTSGVSSRY